MLLKRALCAAAVVATASSLAACGSDSAGGSGGGGGTAAAGSSAGDFGNCDLSSIKANTIDVKPAESGTLTVEAVLPSPGWWNGTGPDTIKDGYEYCMAAALAKMAGLSSVTVKNVSFDQLVAGRTNKFDMALASISITAERAKKVDFSKPYFDSNIGVLVRKGSGITAANVASKRCAAYSGTTAVPFVKEKLKCKTQRIYPDKETLYQSVLSGQSDAAMLDTALVLAEAKQTGGKLEVVGQYKTGEHYGAIYPKGSANGPGLDKGIEKLKKSGFLDKLSKKYLGPAFGGDPNSVPVWKLP